MTLILICTYLLGNKLDYVRNYVVCFMGMFAAHLMVQALGAAGLSLLLAQLPM